MTFVATPGNLPAMSIVQKSTTLLPADVSVKEIVSGQAAPLSGTVKLSGAGLTAPATVSITADIATVQSALNAVR